MSLDGELALAAALAAASPFARLRPSSSRCVAVVGRSWGAVVAAHEGSGVVLPATGSAAAADAAELFLERCAAAAPSPVLGVASVPFRVGNRFHAVERAVLAAEVWDSPHDEVGPAHRCVCTLFRGRLYALELKVEVLGGDDDGMERVTVLAAHDLTGRRSGVANFRVAFCSKVPKRKRDARARQVGEELIELIARPAGSLVFACAVPGGGRGADAAAAEGDAVAWDHQLEGAVGLSDLAFVGENFAEKDADLELDEAAWFASLHE